MSDTPNTATSFLFANERNRDTRRRQDTDRRIRRTWDFVQEEAKSIPVKVGAEKTEQTVAAFKNLKDGRNKPSFDALVAWCHNDKAFAVAFAVQLGVILPGDAEQVEALMRLASAFGRRE